MEESIKKELKESENRLDLREYKFAGEMYRFFDQLNSQFRAFETKSDRIEDAYQKKSRELKQHCRCITTSRIELNTHQNKLKRIKATLQIHQNKHERIEATLEELLKTVRC